MARRPAAGRKPRPLSPYQKRVQRGLAKGLTLQEARGHKPREHVARRERERESGETTYQRGQIRAFARIQAKRMGADEREVYDMLRSWTETHGFERFNELKQRVRTQSKEKRRRVRQRVGERVVRLDLSDRRDDMEELADDWELPDWRLLYYH